MNYEFPIIENIQQIEEAIHGHKEILRMERDNFVLFDYLFIAPETFPNVEKDHHAIRRECRGITFDRQSGNIIRRPFHKFFNLNEREETQSHNIDFKQEHHVLEKLDGSMIAPMIIDNEVLWSTRQNAERFRTSVADFVTRSEHDYEGLVRFCINNGVTPIFEYTSPDNKIVIDYQHEEMCLISARNMKNGHYFPFHMIKNLGTRYNVPIVEHTFNPIEDIDDFINIFRHLKDEREGVVIKFDNGHHIKIKTDQYLAIHKSKQYLTDKDVIRLIIEDRIDDIIPHLMEDDKKAVEKFKGEMFANMIKTIDLIKEAGDELLILNIEKKDIATHPIMTGADPNIQRQIFQYINGSSDNDLLKSLFKHMKKHVASGPRIDSIRHLFGNIHFTDRSLTA